MESITKRSFFLICIISVCAGFLQAQKVLDANMVKSMLWPKNVLHGDTGKWYVVPKDGIAGTISSANLWCIGKNATDSIVGFADRFGHNRGDVWPGPLTTDGNGNIDSATMVEYSRVWKLSRVDIDLLMQAQNNGELQSGVYIPLVDILEWPANAPQGNSHELAPFYDANGDNRYDIYDGDYPLVKGEQMLYCILNDAYGIHTETGLPPMKAEIHVSFYACKNGNATDNEEFINYATFMEYRIVNRSTETYSDIYVGFNVEADVGFAFDDLAGSHVDANAFYFYNQGDDGFEEQPNFYGRDWPVQSIAFLDVFVDSSQALMTSFMTYANSSGSMGDPHIGMGGEYYNLLRSRFRDSSDLHYGGNGYPGDTGVTSMPAKYAYPGLSDPDFYGTGGINPGFGWSMTNPCPSCVGLSSSDKRGVGASGPYTLLPGNEIRMVLGLVSTFDSTLSVSDRIEKNRIQNKLLKEWYDAGVFPCAYPVLSIQDADIGKEMEVFPNPAQSFIQIKGKSVVEGQRYSVSDMNGKVLLQGEINSNGSVEISVGHLLSGIYLVRVSNQVIKFVKQ